MGFWTLKPRNPPAQIVAYPLAAAAAAAAAPAAAATAAPVVVTARDAGAAERLDVYLALLRKTCARLEKNTHAASALHYNYSSSHSSSVDADSAIWRSEKHVALLVGLMQTIAVTTKINRLHCVSKAACKDTTKESCCWRWPLSFSA